MIPVSNKRSNYDVLRRWIGAAAVTATGSVLCVLWLGKRGYGPETRQVQTISGQTAEQVAEEQRTEEIAKLAKYWGEHQDELDRLLHKDYPDALAKWQAVAPEAKAIEEYGKSYEAAFAQRNQAVIAAFQTQKILTVRTSCASGIVAVSACA